MNISIHYCCWNLPKKHLILLPFLIFILFGFLFLINFNIFYKNSFWYFSPKFDFEKRLPCLIRTQIHFQKAFELQNQGLAVLKHLNGKMNLRATWELIPRHFNEIWKNEFQNLDILRLQSDSEEMKYFIKFSNHFRRKTFSCHVITLGVGHSILAERNLSKIYPECHFLAADPASEINANLIENKLGGTFIKAAIGGKTMKKSLTNVWGKDVERRGVQRRIIPQLGIFDFLQKYHTKTEPIDLLLVDVEGAEFGILEQFANSNNFPVPICQINMEIHHPNELDPKYTYSRFFRNFDRLIRGRHFALLHTDIHDDSRYLFLRFFLINIADEICIRKFLC